MLTAFLEHDSSLLNDIRTPYCAIAASKADDPGLQRVFNVLRKHNIKGKISERFSIKFQGLSDQDTEGRTPLLPAVQNGRLWLVNDIVSTEEGLQSGTLRFVTLMTLSFYQ